MPRVLLLATGDTMAHLQHSGRPAVATGTGLLAAAGARVPAAVDVRVEDVLAEPSWDTSPATMLALARRVRAALADDGFDGVVVTHGVDTLEETAFLTDLVTGPATARGGIVFTGALHCLDEPGGGGADDLAAAITAAADPSARGLGALVCFARELHAARWATLADTTSASAFSSAPHPVLGHVTRAGATITAAPPARPPRLGGEPESDVALIKTYPGIPPALLTAATDAGARGVVLEGTGTGNVPVELFTTIAELTEWDIPVVIASRARTHPTALDDPHGATGLATKVGAISARGLAPAHARIALMAALGNGGVDAVRDWFDRL